MFFSNSLIFCNFGDSKQLIDDYCVVEHRNLQRWTDHFFMWDPADYMNISHVFLKASSIWLPMVDIFYSKDSEERTTAPCEKCYVMVQHNGSILSGFPFIYNFPCKINVKYFPFDEQNCKLELANWYLDQRKMDLHPYASTVNLAVFLDNEEWQLREMTVVRKSEFYNYGYFPILTYSLFLKRKPFYYICNLCAPSLIITVAAIIGYHMPSTSTGIHQEKVKMGLTAILSIFILQLGIVDKMPRSSDVIPLISIFYFCLVSLLSLAILSSSLIIVIEKQGVYGKPVPPFLKRLFLTNRRTCRSVCICSKRTKRENGVKYGAFLKCNCDNAQVTDNNCHTMPFHNHITPLSPNSDTASQQTNRYCVWLNSSNSFPMDSLNIAQQSSSPTTLDRTHIPWHKRSCPDCSNSAWTKALLQEMTHLHSTVQKLDNYLQEVKYKQALKAEWSRLADAIEKLSLYGFLFGLLLTIVMFAFHGWY